jgi:hypothetical protein
VNMLTRDRTSLAAAPAISLEANGRKLSTSRRRMGLLQPTPSTVDIGTLRAIYADQGYLWLKQLLDPASVIDFRGWAFANLASSGLIDPGSDPALGLAAGTPIAWSEAEPPLMAVVRSARFEGFCAQRRIADFMDRFLGGLTYLHRRKIMRFVQPGTTSMTPAHYDLTYLRGGTENLVTAWVPLGDTSISMGGLMYLEGSHKKGAQLEAAFREKAQDLPADERISAYNQYMNEGGCVSQDLPSLAEDYDTRWLVADYEAGDVVLHSPFMIHAAASNATRDRRIRLSMDLRYQRVDEPIDARWSADWKIGDGL